MNLRTLKCVVIAGLLAITAMLSAGAWDNTGHMLAAQIARDRLNDKARARVDALAAQLDNNGTPYNGVSIACWPDDIKARESTSPFRGQFRPWHYIDIGCLPTDPDVFRSRPVLTVTNGNVIVALNHCVALIKNRQIDSLVPNEPVALALVMHFVGDIHQPLHTTTRYNPDPKPGDRYKDDAGGNGLTVTNLLDTQWPKNLHTFWDEAYRRYYKNGDVKATPELLEATALGSPEMKGWIKRLEHDAPIKSDLQFDPKAWALEGHAIACTQVYGTLGAPYGSRDVKLQQRYVNEAVRTARRQIVLAGCRLAALLNELYGK